MSDKKTNFDDYFHTVEDPDCPGIFVLLEGDETIEDYHEELRRFREENEIRKQLERLYRTKRNHHIQRNPEGNIMKEILVTKDLYFAAGGDNREWSFSITFSEEEKESSLFITIGDSSKRQVPTEEVVQLWKDLQAVNTQKIIHESERRKGVDNYDYFFDLRNGDNEIAIGFWEPDKSDYESYIKTESYKLITLIENFFHRLGIN